MPLKTISQLAPRLVCVVLLCMALDLSARAQDTVTGAFEGTVTNSQTQARIVGALVEITNQATGISIRRRTDLQGRFYQGLLPPGIYTIRVSAPGLIAQEREQRLFTTSPNQVVPIPFILDPEPVAPPSNTSVQPQPSPPVSPTPPAPTSGAGTTDAERRSIVAEINRTDARRSGAFTEHEVSTLPLGSVTVVRSFDELTLLLPGVAPPPQTLGSVAG